MSQELKNFTKSIADAIRTKKKTTNLINPQDFPSEISSIQTEPNLATKEITANGTYNASDDGVDGYSSVDVSVPQLTLGTTTITKSGIYNATDDGVDGYSEVDVVVGEDLRVLVPENWQSGTSSFIEVDSQTLLFGNSKVSGLYSYNVKTKEFTQIYSGFGYFTYFKRMGNKIIVSDGSDDVLLYNIEDGTVKAQSSISRAYDTFLEIGNICILSYSSQANQLVMYNQETETFSKLPINVKMATYGARIGNKFLFSSNGTNSTYDVGIWLYDMDSNTGSRIYTAGLKWKYFYLVGNRCFISSAKTGLGVLMFNAEDDSITQVSTEDNVVSFQAIGNKVLFGKNVDYRYVGVYNVDDGTYANVAVGLSTGGIWKDFQLVGNKVLVSDSGPYRYQGSTIYSYNPETNTFKSLTSDGRQWVNFQVVGNKCLIGSSVEEFSSGYYGVKLYDSETDSLTSYFNNSASYKLYDTFELDGDNCYIWSSHLSINNRLLYYKASDSSVTEVGVVVDR